MPFSLPPHFVPGVQAPPAAAAPTRWFVFRGRTLLVGANDEPPVLGSLDALGLQVEATHYLGTLGPEPCQAARVADDAEAPRGMRWAELRGLLTQLPSPLMSVAGRAVQVVAWGREHRFCGACGTRTSAVPGRRAVRCPTCQLESFPRLSPAIIVAVERGNEILLARSPHFPEGVHSTLAGFVDPGESVEEAVHREVHEEVGLAITNVRYFASQPWPFPNSLMLGFVADWASGEIDIDGEEIVSADFFAADALPPTFPGRISISQWLLADFLRRRGQPSD